MQGDESEMTKAHRAREQAGGERWQPSNNSKSSWRGQPVVPLPTNAFTALVDRGIPRSAKLDKAELARNCADVQLRKCGTGSGAHHPLDWHGSKAQEDIIRQAAERRGSERMAVGFARAALAVGTTGTWIASLPLLIVVEAQVVRTVVGMHLTEVVSHTRLTKAAAVVNAFVLVVHSAVVHGRLSFESLLVNTVEGVLRCARAVCALEAIDLLIADHGQHSFGMEAASMMGAGASGTLKTFAVKVSTAIKACNLGCCDMINRAIAATSRDHASPRTFGLPLHVSASTDALAACMASAKRIVTASTGTKRKAKTAQQASNGTFAGMVFWFDVQDKVRFALRCMLAALVKPPRDADKAFHELVAAFPRLKPRLIRGGREALLEHCDALTVLGALLDANARPSTMRVASAAGVVESADGTVTFTGSADVIANKNAFAAYRQHPVSAEVGAALLFARESARHAIGGLARPLFSIRSAQGVRAFLEAIDLTTVLELFLAGPDALLGK